MTGVGGSVTNTLQAYIHGVSKKFGESYQKTNKTKDTNKFSLLPFKTVAIRYNTRLTTFVQFPETISKFSCGIDRRTAVTRSLMAFTSAKRAPVMVAFLCQHLSHFIGYSWGSACRWPTRTWLMLSRFLHFANAQTHFLLAVSLPYTCINIFARLCCSFPQFVAEFVCASLHCAVTLPLTLTTFNWPQSVYTAGHMQSMLCVDSPQVSEESCACAHTCAKLPFRYDTIHRTF